MPDDYRYGTDYLGRTIRWVHYERDYGDDSPTYFQCQATCPVCETSFWISTAEPCATQERRSRKKCGGCLGAEAARLRAEQAWSALPLSQKMKAHAERWKREWKGFGGFFARFMAKALGALFLAGGIIALLYAIDSPLLPLAIALANITFVVLLVRAFRK